MTSSKLTFTLPQFIEHFEKRGELVLTANQECTISDFPSYKVETTPSKIIDIFNMILLPLAKEVSINGPKETSWSLKWNESFSLVFTHDVTIKTEKTDITGKIDDLFTMMIASSRLILTLEPKQRLFVWGFSKRELEEVKSAKDLINLFQTRTSYTVGLKIKNGCTISPGTLTNELGVQEGFSIAEAELTLEKQKREYAVLDFLKHFETNDLLTLEGDVDYALKGASQYSSKDPDETFVEEPLKRFAYLLNKIFIVLGRTTVLNFPKLGTCRYTYSDDLTITSQFEMSIQTSKTDLKTRIGDLFACMMAASKLKIEIDPGQKLLITGFTKKQLQQTNSIQEVANLFTKYCPPGFTASLFSNGEITVVKNENNGFFRLAAAKGFTLSLKEAPCYYGLHHFVKALDTRGQITILPGQELIIRDVKLPALLADYKLHFEKTMPFITFLIRNLSILFSEKNICLLFDKEAETPWKAEVDGPYLTIKSTQKLTFAFKDRKEAGVQTLTTMPFLGDLLILNGKRTFTLPANQELFIYGLDQKKYQTLKRVVQEEGDILNEFVAFIQENNPLGYLWTLDRFTGHFEISLVPVRNNEEMFLINIRSDAPMTFRLFRAAGETLIINLLKHASAETLTAFQEADENAFTFLLFQAFYFYCCQEVDIEGIAYNPAFKEATRQEIIKIAKEDGEFKEALDEVNSNDNLYYELKGLLAKTPGEFAKISQDALPEELRIVFSRINSLVYNELYGSPFINKCLQQVQPILEIVKK